MTTRALPWYPRASIEGDRVFVSPYQLTPVLVLLLFNTSFPARAQQPFEGSPACAKYADKPLSHAQCEYNESVRRTQEAEREAACLDSLTTGIRNGSYRKEDVKVLLAGKSVREADACKLLQQLKK